MINFNLIIRIYKHSCASINNYLSPHRFYSNKLSMRSVLNILTVLSVTVLKAYAKEELLFALEVSRHGARAPKVLLPLMKEEADDFKVPEALTPFGEH